MNAPEKIVAAYRRQALRRLAWFVLAVVLGCGTAAVAKYVLGSAYPWWWLAVLVSGLLYVPWFVAQAFRRDCVSLREVLRARKELRAEKRQ